MSFVGLRICAELQGGSSITGFVQHVDETTLVLSMADLGDGVLQPSVQVPATRIKDIKVIDSAQAQQGPPGQVSSRPEQTAPRQAIVAESRPQRTETAPANQSDVSAGPTWQQQQQQRQQPNQQRGRRGANRMQDTSEAFDAHLDLSEISDDFDFVSSNAKFDKKKEFTILARGIAEEQQNGVDADFSSRTTSSAREPSRGKRQTETRQKSARVPSAGSASGSSPAPGLFVDLSGQAVDACSVDTRQRLLAAMETTFADAEASGGGDFESAKSAARALMFENIARSTASLVWRRYLEPDVGGQGASSSVIVLVGTGLLGCVGLAVARQLHARGVQRVSVCRARAYNLPPEHASQRALNRLVSAGSSRADANQQSTDSVGTRQFHHPHAGGEVHVGSLPVSAVDVIVDCLLGSTTSTPVIEPSATLVRWANHNGAPIVSLDVPSGVNAETGALLGSSESAIHATITLALAIPLSTPFRPEIVGDLWVVDAGIPSGIYEKIGLKRPSWTHAWDGVIPISRQ